MIKNVYTVFGPTDNLVGTIWLSNRIQFSCIFRQAVFLTAISENLSNEKDTNCTMDKYSNHYYMWSVESICIHLHLLSS